MFILGILVAVVMLLTPSQALAAYGINRTINFQGKLVTSAGVNVPNSTPVTATFSIYQTNSSCPGGGTAVWSENQTFTPVDGMFQVALGSQTAFASLIDFSQDTLYLGIQVSGESNEMCSGSSRIKLAAVPYALNAEKFAGMSGDNSQTNYFTVTGGQGTPATLKVDGNITIGSIITPTAAGGLTIKSNGANTMTIDTGSAAALNIGATSNAITIGTATNSNGLTLNSGTGDIALVSTDDIFINGGGASAVINIANNAVAQNVNIGNTTGGTITIGQSTGSDLALQDANWGITGAGAANFATLSGAGLANCTGANNNLTWSSSTSTFGCASLSAKSFISTTSVGLVDGDTTNYYVKASENNNLQANISLSNSSNQIYGIVSMEVTSNTTQDQEVVGRVERNVSADVTCNSGTPVGGTTGMFSTNTGVVKTSTVTFLDNPGTTSEYRYTLCSSSLSAGNMTGNVTRVRFTLFELANAADLAEVYPSSDTTLRPGEVVTLGGVGVERSQKMYDARVVGVVSTEPALVIGGTGDQAFGIAVALSGRVPVRVSNVGGKITKGDMLTSASSPGLAMKATKAGSILGMAMEDFDQEGSGTIMMFVKPGYYTGDNIAEIMGQNGDPFQPKQVISNLLQNKPEQITADISQLLTDRVVAGLEIITPTLYVDQIFAESILAGKIQVRQIEGIENLIASESARLVNSDGLEILSQKYMALENKMASISGLLANSPTPTLVSPNPTLTPTPTLDMKVLGQLLAMQGLTVSGPTVFGDSVEFKIAPEFSNDTAGFGIIHPETNRVEIVFDKEYKYLPIIIINKGDLGVVDKTTRGFWVESKKSVKEDIKFSWMAIAVKNPKTFESILPTPTLIPTTIPIPTATREASPSAMPTPTLTVLVN